MPDKRTLQAYLKRGLTQQQITEAWRQDSGEVVSRGAIGLAISRYGLKSAHTRPRYDELIPWTVRKEHSHHYDLRMLRLEGRRRAGKRLSAADRQRVESWTKKLDEANASVHYMPDHPQWFVWISPRREGEDLVRMPDDS